jgi:hypothetical protein
MRKCGVVREILLLRGVDVEASISDVRAADKFIGSGLASRCLRILIEPGRDRVNYSDLYK